MDLRTVDCWGAGAQLFQRSPVHSSAFLPLLSFPYLLKTRHCDIHSSHRQGWGTPKSSVRAGHRHLSSLQLPALQASTPAEGYRSNRACISVCMCVSMRVCMCVYRCALPCLILCKTEVNIWISSSIMSHPFCFYLFVCLIYSLSLNLEFTVQARLSY